MATNFDVKPSPGLRDKLLKAAANPVDALASYSQRLQDLFDLSDSAIKAQLQRLHSTLADTGDNRESLYKHGVALLHFDGGERVAGADCGFVIMQPDSQFPVHTHSGEERTLVIQGELLMDDGQAFLAGDWCVADVGSSHSFRSVGELPAVLAVVVDDRVSFNQP